MGLQKYDWIEKMDYFIGNYIFSTVIELNPSANFVHDRILNALIGRLLNLKFLFFYIVFFDKLNFELGDFVGIATCSTLTQLFSTIILKVSYRFITWA